MDVRSKWHSNRDNFKIANFKSSNVNWVDGIYISTIFQPGGKDFIMLSHVFSSISEKY